MLTIEKLSLSTPAGNLAERARLVAECDFGGFGVNVDVEVAELSNSLGELFAALVARPQVNGTVTHVTIVEDALFAKVHADGRYQWLRFSAELNPALAAVFERAREALRMKVGEIFVELAEAPAGGPPARDDVHDFELVIDGTAASKDVHYPATFRTSRVEFFADPSRGISLNDSDAAVNQGDGTWRVAGKVKGGKDGLHVWPQAEGIASEIVELNVPEPAVSSGAHVV